MLALERKVQIGQRIADLRYGQALTQAELAEVSGVNAITISNIERGEQKPSARTLRRLAAAFEMQVRELTAGTTGPPRESPPDTPGETEENERRIEEAKIEKAERDEEARLRRGEDDTGGRVS